MKTFKNTALQMLTILAMLVFPEIAQASFNIPNTFFQNHPQARVFTTPGSLVSRLILNAIVFAGVLFFALIVYAGYQLIIYGGQFNPPQRVAQAKSMITHGLIGFLIVVAAYFILQMVGVITGINFASLPQL